MRADGSEATLLVPGNVGTPDLSHDGQYALYQILSTAGGATLNTIHAVRLSDGSPAEFEQLGRRARFAPDGHSIFYIDNTSGSIMRKDFPSPTGAPTKVVVPASPDMPMETFHISPDGRRLVIAYTQATWSLMVADGVADVMPPGRAK
jgi:hypothetical protein